MRIRCIHLHHSRHLTKFRKDSSEEHHCICREQSLCLSESSRFSPKLDSCFRTYLGASAHRPPFAEVQSSGAGFCSWSSATGTFAALHTFVPCLFCSCVRSASPSLSIRRLRFPSPGEVTHTGLAIHTGYTRSVRQTPRRQFHSKKKIIGYMQRMKPCHARRYTVHQRNKFTGYF